MPSPRYPELDLLRTVAIAAMVAYHAAYDLAVFHHWDIDVFDGGWRLMARATATLFLLLVGVSYVVSRKRSALQPVRWRRQWRRAGILLAAASLVSLATWVADPETYVRFGILHLIGVSAVFLPAFERFGTKNAVIGLFVLLLGPLVHGTRVATSWLLPLGFMPQGFTTVDYFPLFPWFGVILLGMGIGHLVYVRLGRTPDHGKSVPRFLRWPGKHSLLIYLLHQPLLIGLLWAWSMLAGMESSGL